MKHGVAATIIAFAAFLIIAPGGALASSPYDYYGYYDESDRYEYTYEYEMPPAPIITSVSPERVNPNGTVTVYGHDLSRALYIQFFDAQGRMSSTAYPSSSYDDTLTFNVNGMRNGALSSGAQYFAVVTPYGTSNTASVLVLAPARAKKAPPANRLGANLNCVGYRSPKTFCW